MTIVNNRDAGILATLFFLTAVLANCSPESTSGSIKAEVIVLNNAQTVISAEETLMGMPAMLKYEEATGHIFVYDINQKLVYELNNDGQRLAEYGGLGRGPGELQSFGNLFVTDNYVYILDPRQFFIHKYNRSGDVVSTLDYGQLLKDENPPEDPRQGPPPQIPLNDLNNEPFITLNGNVLLPTHENEASLYKLFSWNGNELATIGEIPELYLSSATEEQTKTAYENREVPARDMYRAFPVNDPDNPGELFIVYSSIPKIAKYDTSGQKLWEQKVTDIPELDSLAQQYYNFAEKNPKALSPIKKYASGKAGPNGELYLSTFTGALIPGEFPLWIHHFSPRGELVSRYKVANDNTLLYYPGIDVSGRRIFVAPLNDVVVKSYSF